MGTSDEFDVGEGAKAPDSLANLKVLLGEAIALEEFVDQAEIELKAAKAALQAIKTARIPDAMAEIQTDRMNYGGYEISVNDFVSGSLPKEPVARTKAIDLLASYEAEGLITTDIKMTFSKSEHNLALDLAARLKAEGYSVDVQSSVHSQTLCKFARERIESGLAIDAEALGLYTGKVAKFKPLKKRAEG